MADNERLSLLAEHFRETFAHQRDYIRRRDLAFGLAVLGGVLLAVRVSDMSASDRVVGALISRLVGENLALGGGVLVVLLWFVQFALVVRYFQAAMTVERHYGYIEKLEAEMCRLYGADVLARESASYLANYPKFSDWIHFVYTRIFPATLALLVVAGVVPEYSARGPWSLVVWLVLLLAGGTLATIGLFVRYTWACESSKGECTPPIPSE